MDEIASLLAEGKLEAAYARAIAQGDPRSGAIQALMDVRRAIYRKDYRGVIAYLERPLEVAPPDLLEGVKDLDAGRYEPWLDHPFLGAEAWVQKGVEAAMAGDKEAAAAAFAEALRRDPKHPRAWVNQANLHLEAGDVERAIEAYKKALEIDPELADAHYNLAAAYKKKGDLDRMVRHLKRSQRLKLYPPRLGQSGPAGRPPVYLRFWFWAALVIVIYLLTKGAF